MTRTGPLADLTIIASPRRAAGDPVMLGGFSDPATRPSAPARDGHRATISAGRGR